MAKLELPLVGVDPAIVLSYRDEYKEILGDMRGNFHVITAHEWLTTQLNSERFKSAVENLIKIENDQKTDRTFNTAQWYLFPHCTEATAMPNSPKEWQQIFAAFGQQLQVENVACCGMAGVFGHEVRNQNMSRDIYDSSWSVKLRGKDPAFCLATGYSCRSQVNRFEQWKPKHPLQALLTLLN